MEWGAMWCSLLKELFQLCVLIKWTAVLWLESKKSSGKDFVTCVTKISCLSVRSLSRKQVMETCKKHIGCLFVTVSRKQAMRVCGECCSKIIGANATQFFLFHFQGLWSRHTQDCAEESWTQRFCAMYYSYSWEESGIYRFFFTVVVISLLGTVQYDFENRVQTSGVETRLGILYLNFIVFRRQTPRMSNFECSWVCFQFLLNRYLTLFFQYISASWDKTVRIWNAYKKSEFLGLCQLISFVTTWRPMYLGTLQLR